jgi:Protein of unknown function (DUF1838)
MVKHLLLAASLLAIAGAATAAPKRLDLTKPEDAVTAQRKIGCSLKDMEPVVYHFAGEVYARVEGEPDRHVFDAQGMNVRQCVTVNDPVRGKGYRMVSRELLLYTDPKTGEIIRTWDNPWTGRKMEVVHVANDPVNMRSPTFPIDKDGKPYKFEGRIQNGRIFMPAVVPLWYKNPLGGDYQDYVGNQYHSMEIFDFVAEEADLLDATKTRANPSVAWVRMSPWLPWMEMTGRNGVMIFNAVGQTMPNGISDLPKVIRDEIALNYPIYDRPPPVDDARPNETSWTYFKKKIDARRAAEKAAQAAPK